MEQIFMIEVFVKKIILKVEPKPKDEYELRMEAEEREREEKAAALAALLAAAKKGKKGKAKKPKAKKGKKGKKGKEPPGPSEEEMKFMQTCSMQMNCPPLFNFNVAHDNFVPPPPPPPPPKGKKGKKGKKAKPKPKPKGKKKGKGKKPPPFKVALPSEPLPIPPFFGVGNSVVFLARPSKLADILRETPIYVTVWNRDQNFSCTGFVIVNWHKSFFECLEKAEQLNPMNMKVEYRDTSTPEITVNTVEMSRPLQCEEDLEASGEIDFYIKLTCLGYKVLSYFVSLPEMDRLPGRKYLQDDLSIKDVEVVRHWDGTTIGEAPPVAYFYSAPDILRAPLEVPEPPRVYDDFVAPFTQDELAILAMGFPKGPCGGTNCPRRMEFRGSQHLFIFGEKIKVKRLVKTKKSEKMKTEIEYKHGMFVNKRDVHGPCGRLDCPLAKKIRNYLCNEGCFKPCRKPCSKEYY